MIDGMDMHFENDELILNGENINSLITMPNISKNVSAYASIREVREEVGKMASVTSAVPEVRAHCLICSAIWRRLRISSWMEETLEQLY